LQLRDEFRFIAAPRKGACPFGHCRPFRPGCWCYPDHPADRSTLRTLDPGLLARAIPGCVPGPTCYRAWQSADAQPDVRFHYIRHRRSGYVSRMPPGSNNRDSGTLRVIAQRYRRTSLARLPGFGTDAQRKSVAPLPEDLPGRY
jgi:hypothetical protein